MSSRMSTSDQTAIPAVLIGTGAWLVALVVVSLTMGVTAPTSGVWWWGVCLVGSASGLIGLVFLRWRRLRLIRSGGLT
jgi:hypothetical protein